MATRTKRRCRRCDSFRWTRVVMKFGNGTYRRAGHWREASICEECAKLLLQDVQPGQQQTKRWSVRGLRNAWKIKEN